MPTTTSCQQRVRETIAEHHLIEAGDVVLVAVSGGADSVALLALLGDLRTELGITLHGVHVNHCLRPDAADDAAFVRTLATSFDIPVTVESIDVTTLARRERRSLEDAGRMARYRVFAQVASDVGARRVATAHTWDDQVETVLMRVLQNARWETLAGIPSARPLGSAMVVRPLYKLPRADLHGFLHARGILWREDPTNRDQRIFRNWIRHAMRPTLAREHPQVGMVLSQVSEVVAANEAFLHTLTLAAWARLVRRTGTGLALPLQEFRRLSLAVQRRLVGVAIEAIPGTTRPTSRGQEAKVIWLGTKASAGAEVDLGSCLVRRGYEMLEFLPHLPAAPRVRYRLPVPGTVTAEAFGMVVTAELVAEGQGGALPPTAREVSLDAASIGTPLEVRPWRPGDRFVPLGLVGRKKLQDFFVDTKVPRWDRSRVPLLVDEHGQIVWVIGHRLAETARVTAATTQVARIRVHAIHPGLA